MNKTNRLCLSELPVCQQPGLCSQKPVGPCRERENIVFRHVLGLDARRTLEQKHNFNAKPDFL